MIKVKSLLNKMADSDYLCSHTSTSSVLNRIQIISNNVKTSSRAICTQSNRTFTYWWRKNRFIQLPFCQEKQWCFLSASGRYRPKPICFGSGRIHYGSLELVGNCT